MNKTTFLIARHNSTGWDLVPGAAYANRETAYQAAVALARRSPLEALYIVSVGPMNALSRSTQYAIGGEVIHFNEFKKGPGNEN